MLIILVLKMNDTELDMNNKYIAENVILVRDLCILGKKYKTLELSHTNVQDLCNSVVEKMMVNSKDIACAMEHINSLENQVATLTGTINTMSVQTNALKKNNTFLKGWIQILERNIEVLKTELDKNIVC